MRSFKRFLTESDGEAPQLVPWHPKSVKEVHERIRAMRKRSEYRDWTNGELKTRTFGKYKVNPDLSVSLLRELIVDDWMLDNEGRLPVQFDSSGPVRVYTKNLTTMVGFPRNVIAAASRSFVGGNSKALSFAITPINLRDLEGFPKVCYAGVDLSMMDVWKNFTLKGFHKHAEAIYGTITVPKSYEGPILSLLYVKGLAGIWMSASMSTSSPKLKLAASILNKHLDGGKGNNVLECQEELISAGLKEFAKL